MKTKLTEKFVALILGVNAVKWISYSKPPLQLEMEISQSPKQWKERKRKRHVHFETSLGRAQRNKTPLYNSSVLSRAGNV